MAKIGDIHVHVHHSDEETEDRLRCRIRMLERVVEALSAIIDQMAAIDTTQEAEIVALKGERDALTAEINEVVALATAHDPDPNYPQPTTSPPPGE